VSKVRREFAKEGYLPKVRREFSTENVYDMSCERVAKLVDRFDRISVAFSGGKDSTVVLQVALDVARQKGKLPIDVAFFDEECISLQTVEYVERVRQMDGVNLRWLCLPVMHRNSCSERQPWWSPWAPEDEKIWVRALPEGAITADMLPRWERRSMPKCNEFIYPREWGTVCQLNGVRAQESMLRYHSVIGRTEDNYIHVDNFADGNGIYKAKPIYDWKTEDVWTAPAKFGWDTNKTYELLSAVGVPMASQRCAPPFGEEPSRGLWYWALCWPELWEKCIGRVPGARTAAKYSRSPLYGASAADIPGPAPGQTWEERVREEILKWMPADRPRIAECVRWSLRYWNKKTGNKPVIDSYWKYLLKVVMKGDFKGRMQYAAMAAIPVELIANDQGMLEEDDS